MKNIVDEFKKRLLLVYKNPDVENYNKLKLKYIRTVSDNRLDNKTKFEAMLLISKIEIISDKPFYKLDSINELISYFDFNFRYGTDKRMDLLYSMMDFLKFLQEEPDCGFTVDSVNAKVFNKLYYGKYRKMLEDIYVDKRNFSPVFRFSIKRRCRKIRNLNSFLLNSIFEHKCFDPLDVVYAALLFLGLNEKVMERVEIVNAPSKPSLMIPMFDYKIGKYRKVVYNPKSRLELVLFGFIYKEYGTNIGEILYENNNLTRKVFLGATTYITSTRRNYITTMHRKYKYPESGLDNIFKSSLSNLISISCLNKMRESELSSELRKEIINTDREYLLSYSMRLYDDLRKSDKIKYLFVNAEDIYNYHKYKNNIIYNNDTKFKKLKGFDKKYSV